MDDENKYTSTLDIDREKSWPVEIELQLRRLDDTLDANKGRKDEHLVQVGFSDSLLNTSGGSENVTCTSFRPNMRKNVHSSMPDLSFAGRRQQYGLVNKGCHQIKPMTMREYDRLLDQLRKENWDLKLELSFYKRMTPQLKNLTNDNVIQMNVDLRNQLDNLKLEHSQEQDRICQLQEEMSSARCKFEQQLESIAGDNETLRAQFNGQIDKNQKLEMLLFEGGQKAKQMQQELQDLKENSAAGSDSEANSNISLMSERDKRIIDLQTRIVDKDIDVDALKRSYELRICQLEQLVNNNDKTPCTDETLLEQTLADQGSLVYNPLDEQLKQRLESDVIQKGHRIEQLTGEIEQFTEQLADIQQQFQHQQHQFVESESALEMARNDISKRDKAIQGLCSRLKKCTCKIGESTDMSRLEKSNNCLSMREIRSDIARLRVDLDQLTLENGQLQQQVKSFDKPDDNSSSLVDFAELAKRTDRMNRVLKRRLEKIADKFGREQQQIGEIDELNDSENDHSFDAAASYGPKGNADIRRVSFAPDSTSNLWNLTVNTSVDLACLKSKLTTLRRISDRMYQKLQGSATFLKKLLEELGDDRARQFIDDFESLHIDLSESMRQTRDLIDDVECAEKSIGDIVEHLDRTFGVNKPIETVEKSAQTCRLQTVALMAKIATMDKIEQTSEIRSRDQTHQIRPFAVEIATNTDSFDVDKLISQCANYEQYVGQVRCKLASLQKTVYFDHQTHPTLSTDELSTEIFDEIGHHIRTLQDKCEHLSADLKSNQSDTEQLVELGRSTKQRLEQQVVHLNQVLELHMAEIDTLRTRLPERKVLKHQANDTVVNGVQWTKILCQSEKHERVCRRRMTEMIDNEKKLRAELATIGSQLDVNNKELERRLEEHRRDGQLADEKLKIADDQRARLDEALREAEHKIEGFRMKHKMNSSRSTSVSSTNEARKSSLPEADMATNSEVNARDRLKREIQEASRCARRLAKFIKSMAESNSDVTFDDWKLLDRELKTLRNFLDASLRLTSSCKENIEPDDSQMVAEKSENDKLRQLLLNSQQMLQIAHTRLKQAHPETSSTITDDIVRELSQIRQVLQKTRQDVSNSKHRLHRL